MKHPKDVVKSVQALVDENHHLLKNIELLYKEKTRSIKADLLQKIKTENGVNFIAEKIDLNNADAVKDLMFQIKGERDNLFMVIGAELNGKATLSVMLSDNVMKEKNLNATQIIKEIAKEINGGGGGQPFYATAGGTNVDGLTAALAKAKNFLN